MSNFRNLLVVARPHAKPLISASILTGTLTLVGLLPPLLMRRLVNDVAKQGNWGLFELIIGLMVAVPLFRAGISILNNRFTRRTHLTIIGDLRKKLFTHLMGLSLDGHRSQSPSNMARRLMGDVVNLSSFVSQDIILLITNVTTIVFVAAVMLTINLPLTGLTLALLPLYYLNYRFFRSRLKASTGALRTCQDHVSANLQERLSAHELIQVFGREDAQQRDFVSLARQVMDAAMHGSATSVTYGQLTHFLQKIGNSLIYVYACRLYLKGDIGYGDVIAFSAYAVHLLGPIVRLTKCAGNYARATVSIERITKMTESSPENLIPAGNQRFDGLKCGIECRGIVLKAGNDIVLNDLNESVSIGEVVAVVAPAEAARRGLVRLFLRRCEPAAGELLVNGRPVIDWEDASYRRKVIPVHRETALFDGTIRENLIYGDPDAIATRVEEICKAIGIHDFVAPLKHGYDTRVGCNGVRLPAGIRQLIGIARALIAKPSVLIADEATIPLDPETADRAMEVMATFMKHGVVIIVDSRAAAGNKADRLIVLESGRINGSRDES